MLVDTRDSAEYFDHTASVDGEVKFGTGTMSDSDPAREADVPLVGAGELRLAATDAGDGTGCDMASWAEACLVRDLWVPFFGDSIVTEVGSCTNGEATTPQSLTPRDAPEEYPSCPE